MSYKLCLLALTASCVSALGTGKRAITPEKIYGKGHEYEQKVHARRAAEGLGAATQFNFTQQLDHFNNSDTNTFPMRYLIDTTYYNSTKAPILFYAGNEGNVMNFYDNTGFMTETLA